MAGAVFDYVVAGETFQVSLASAEYMEGGTALLLNDAETQQPTARATVHVAGYRCRQDELLIKTWSENETMLAFLVENDLVVDTGRRIPCGHAEAALVRQTPRLRTLLLLEKSGSAFTEAVEHAYRVVDQRQAKLDRARAAFAELYGLPPGSLSEHARDIVVSAMKDLG